MLFLPRRMEALEGAVGDASGGKSDLHDDDCILGAQQEFIRVH